MKKIELITMNISLVFCIGAVPQAKPNLHVNNNNKQTIEQHITISLEKPKLSDCSSLQGTPLKECMACQGPESFRENMKALNDYTAVAYWKSLELREYVDALCMYTSEQWAEFYKSRDAQNQHLFTPELHNLKRRIKLLYINAYYLWIGSYLYSGQDADKVDDLSSFIATYEIALQKNQIIPFNDAALHRNFQAVKNYSFGQSRI